MNNTITHSNQYRPNTINSSILFNQKFNKPTYKKSNNRTHSPIIHNTRPRHAQALLTAILELLRVEATAVGLEKEAILLTHSILKRNYIQRRS